MSEQASVAITRRDYGEAAALATESLQVARQLNALHNIGDALYMLGRSRAGEGDLASAVEALREGLLLVRDIEDRTSIPDYLEATAGLMLATGFAASATRLFAAAETARAESGLVRPPSQRSERESELDTARARLGDAEFQAAWAKGSSCAIMQAAVDALEALDSLAQVVDRV